METLSQDLRYAFRMLAKSPGFTAVAVIVLALGIGANTAIFSVVNAVLLRSLPFNEPERIVAVDKIAVKGGFGGTTGREFLDWQEQSESLEQVAAHTYNNFNLSGGGEPERVPCAQVSATLFPLLGVQPLMGRTFLAEEDRPGHNQVAVVSQGFWRRRFGNDSSLTDQSLMLNGKSYTVVGVMPASFEFPRGFDVWLPIALDAKQERGGEIFTFVDVIGRLKPEITIERTASELAIISSRLPDDGPGHGAEMRIEVVRLHEQLVKNVRLAVLVLLGAVGFVLLIACANVANLMLARAATRQKEMAIRVAVGAGRWRLVRQLLTESVVIAFLGGSIGVLLAMWGIDLLLAAIPPGMAKTFHGLNGIGIDKQALAFTLVVSMVTGIVFGIAPAFAASKPDLTDALKEGGRTARFGYGMRSLRGLLVVAELALALVLLVGAGLMIKSFVRLIDVEPGFRAENVLTMRLELPRAKYGDPQRATQFFEQVLARVGTLPAVESAGAISHRLSEYTLAAFFQVEGSPPPREGQDKAIIVGIASPDYFHAMGIPLLNGRFFDERDNRGSTEVVLINESMARRFFADQDPIGKGIGFDCKTGFCRKIVGVVGNIRQQGLDVELQPEVYVPYLQYSMRSTTLVIHSAADPASLVAAVRSQVQAVDKDQPISDVKTMKRYLSESVAQPRLTMALLGIFAAIALVLAAVGIYGMMTYTVAGRTREIGIRMALGAQRRDVIRLVVGQAAALTVIGTAMGLAGALALTRVMESLLFQVSATDPFTFAAISVLLAGVALGASFVPARRATKVDPMIALRSE
ncbi:MAG: ABC transporter permease [Acidobacteriota bacterium]